MVTVWFFLSWPGFQIARASRVFQPLSSPNVIVPATPAEPGWPSPPATGVVNIHVMSRGVELSDALNSIDQFDDSRLSRLRPSNWFCVLLSDGASALVLTV